MTFTPEQIAQLNAPLNPAMVKLKPTAGSPRYIEGHEAMNAANRIFGYDGWGYVVESESHLEAPGGFLYSAVVTVTVVGCVPKRDIGTEIASNSKEGKPPTVREHETAKKGAVTDGIKRALRSFGDQFGASLYDKDSNINAEYAAWQREQNATSNGHDAKAAAIGDDELAALKAELAALFECYPDAKAATAASMKKSGATALSVSAMRAMVAKLKARVSADDLEPAPTQRRAEALSRASSLLAAIKERPGGGTTEDIGPLQTVLGECQAIWRVEGELPVSEIKTGRGLMEALQARVDAERGTPASDGQLVGVGR